MVTPDDQPFTIGKAYALRDGTDALVVSTGITTKVALDAATALAQEGLSTAVLHVPTIKPLDVAMILRCAAKAPVVVTIEEHTLPGGLGSAIAELLLENGLTPRFKRLGIPDVFPDQYGSQASLLEHYGLTSANLSATVQQLHRR